LDKENDGRLETETKIVEKEKAKLQAKEKDRLEEEDEIQIVAELTPTQVAEAESQKESEEKAKCDTEAIEKVKENEAKTKAEEKDRLEAEKKARSKNRIEAKRKAWKSRFAENVSLGSSGQHTEGQNNLQAFTGIKFVNEDGQNKCYLNTCLNAILSSDTVRKAVRDYSGQCQCKLCKYLLFILDNQSLIHDAKDIRTWSHMRDQFGSLDQQDIDEFLCALIDECKVLKELIQFDTITRRICNNCQSVSYDQTVENQTTLKCAIYNQENALNNTPNMVDVKMSSNFNKKCDNCELTNPEGSVTAHSVTEKFKKIPKVFVMFVNRIADDGSKIDKDVHPSALMYLNELNDRKHEFFLKSVAKHGGDGDGGHYTCGINMAFAWRICDDATNFQVFTNAPLDGYLLVYESKIEAMPMLSSLTTAEQEVVKYFIKCNKNAKPFSLSDFETAAVDTTDVKGLLAMKNSKLALPDLSGKDFAPMTPPMTPYSMISTPVSQHPAIAKKFLPNEATPMTPDSMISTPGTPALDSPTHVTFEQNHEEKNENYQNSVVNFTFEMILAMNPDLHLGQDPSEKVSNSEVQELNSNIEKLENDAAANTSKEFESSVATPKKSCEAEKLSNAKNIELHDTNIEELKNNTSANISKKFESCGVLQHLPRASLDQNDKLLKQFEKYKVKQALDKYRKNKESNSEMISPFQIQTVVPTRSAYTKKRVRQGTYPNAVKRKRTGNLKPENQPKPKLNEVIDDFVLPGLLN
jgi:hypothetical protein